MAQLRFSGIHKRRDLAPSPRERCQDSPRFVPNPGRQVEATDFPAGDASGLRISASVIATPILIDALRPRKARVNARFRLHGAVTVAVSGVTAIP